MAKILVVDNNPVTIEEVGAILRDAGHVVDFRHDTRGLSDFIHETHPDLIILGIYFNDDAHAGIKAARVLTNDPHLCRIPILMLSAINCNSRLPLRISESDISEDFLPIDAFIDKPVQTELLLEKVERLLTLDPEQRIRHCRSMS